MKSVVLGTAGHVDHGKTALVQALTGVNTDRWVEERERGITIDLGFAAFPAPDPDLEISVVDVPGHEDFVRNMLAGATGIDVLLLVVAADEGPMPQTREHLWIARLLDVPRALVAISKADLVDEEWLALVRQSVRQEIERIFGGCDWPLIAVSSVSRRGLEELSGAIVAAAQRVRARLDTDLFRLPVDRSFSLRGVGTVVTGSVWSGRAEAGAELRVLPGGRVARVRSVQVHGRDVAAARAGQRAALALTAIERDQVGRGDVLVGDDAWRETRCLDARLFLTPDSPRPLRQRQRCRFHLGTAEVLGRVVLYDCAELEPGGTATAQLRLEGPLVARTGDRFVVRSYSPVTTVGGGVVLDPWAARRARLVGPEAAALRAVADGTPRERARAVLEGRPGGASAADLTVLLGFEPAALARELRSAAAAGVIREIGGRWYPTGAIQAARAALLEALAESHARDAHAPGVSLEALRSGSRRPAGLVNAALSDLEREGLIRVSGSLAALAEHVPTLSTGQEATAAAAQACVREGRLAPPTVREMAARLGRREEELIPVLKFLAERGDLVAVTPDLYYDRQAIEEAKARLAGALAGGRAGPPSELRELLGVTRKHLIPLLEYLDAAGFTRRTPAGRVLR